MVLYQRFFYTAYEKRYNICIIKTVKKAAPCKKFLWSAVAEWVRRCATEPEVLCSIPGRSGDFSDGGH